MALNPSDKAFLIQKLLQQPGAKLGILNGQPGVLVPEPVRAPAGAAASSFEDAQKLLPPLPTGYTRDMRMDIEIGGKPAEPPKPAPERPTEDVLETLLQSLPIINAIPKPIASMEDEQTSVQKQQKIADLLEKQQPEFDLSGLMLAADVWGGGKGAFQKGYQRPMSFEEKQKLLYDMQQGVTRGRAGISKNDMDLLQSILAAKYQRVPMVPGQKAESGMKMTVSDSKPTAKTKSGAKGGLTENQLENLLQKYSKQMTQASQILQGTKSIDKFVGGIYTQNTAKSGAQKVTETGKLLGKKFLGAIGMLDTQEMDAIANNMWQIFTTVKEMSGAAATDTERKEYEKIISPKTVEAFRAGQRWILDKTLPVLKGVKAETNPKVRELYRQRNPNALDVDRAIRSLEAFAAGKGLDPNVLSGQLKEKAYQKNVKISPIGTKRGKYIKVTQDPDTVRTSWEEIPPGNK